jgi:hypothetical protein
VYKEKQVFSTRKSIQAAVKRILKILNSTNVYEQQDVVVNKEVTKSDPGPGLAVYNPREKINNYMSVKVTNHTCYGTLTKSRQQILALPGLWWLTSVILATQEAEIRRIMVQSQLEQTVPRDPISK